MAKTKKPKQEAMRDVAQERVRDLPAESAGGRLERETGISGGADPEMEPGERGEQLGEVSPAVREQMARQPQIKPEG